MNNNHTPHTVKVEFPKASQQLLSVIISVFAGLVLVKGISDFYIILEGLGFDQNKVRIIYGLSINDYIIFFSIVAFILNIFRMVHGLIISMYDERNPTHFGPLPLNFEELSTFILTILTPYLSLILLKNFSTRVEYFPLLNNEISSNVYLITILFLPNLVYIIWDSKLLKEINNGINHGKYSSIECDFYLEKVENWLKIDKSLFGIVIVIFFLSIIYGLAPNANNNILQDIGFAETFLLIFIFVQVWIFYYDYIKINNDFYFPTNKINKEENTMPPSGYNKNQNNFIISFLDSCSKSLHEESISKNLTYFDALSSEIVNIDSIIAHEETGEVQKNVLQITKSFYNRILKEQINNTNDFNFAVKKVLEQIRIEIYDIKVPELIKQN